MFLPGTAWLLKNFNRITVARNIPEQAQQRTQLKNTVFLLDKNTLGNTYGIHPALASRPLDAANVVRGYFRYARDIDQYHIPEHWPLTPAMVYDIIESGCDDCDGLSVTWVTVLHTFGYTDAQICISWFGDAPPDGVWQVNHAHGLILNPENPNDPFIVELTTNDFGSRVPTLSECPKYHLFASSDGARTMIWRDECETA